MANDVKALQAQQSSLEASVKALQTSVSQVFLKADANTQTLASILKVGLISVLILQKQESFSDSIEGMLQGRADPENPQAN